MTSAADEGPAPRRRGRPSNFNDRTLRVLDVAAGILNEDGLTNASLETLSRKLGLNKSSLYYYFKNKEELVYKCYLRACRVGVQHAVDAAAGAGTARERFARYLRMQTSESDPPLALVGDITVLSPEHRAEILQMLREHDAQMRGLLDEGARDGSFVISDSRLINFAVIGALNWGLLWERPDTRRATRAEMGEGFEDVFLNGLKPPGPPMTDFPEPVSVLPPPPASVDVFSREFQANQRREALFRAAAIFFERNGYDNANLDDVVEHLGVSKGALYHYVSSKEELLYGCYLRSLDLTGQVISAIEAEPGDGLYKVIRYVSSMIELHAGPAGPIANFIRLKSLSPGHQDVVRERSRLLQRSGFGFLEQGVADGSIRPVNVGMARLAVTGAVNWIPRWYSPSGPSTPREIAASFAGLLANGLTPRVA